MTTSHNPQLLTPALGVFARRSRVKRMPRTLAVAVFCAWLQRRPHTRTPSATSSAAAASTAPAATGVSARLMGRMRASVVAWERTAHLAVHAWAHAVWHRRRLAANWRSAVRLGDSRPLWRALCGWVEHVAFERLRRELGFLQPPLGLGLYQEARGALRWLQRHRGREGVPLLTPPRTLHAVCDVYVVSILSSSPTH